MDLKDLKTMIAAGESQTVEFKESFGEETLETLAAFANSSGGTVLIGVTDSAGIIGAHVGKESLRAWANRIAQVTSLNPVISKLDINGKCVVRITVAESPVKPVACSGRYFKRVNNSNRRMTDDDITRVVLQKVGVTWDEIIEPRATMVDISKQNLLRFRAICNEKQRRIVPAKDSALTVLEKLGLIKKENFFVPPYYSSGGSHNLSTRLHF